MNFDAPGSIDVGDVDMLFLKFNQCNQYLIDEESSVATLEGYYTKVKLPKQFSPVQGGFVKAATAVMVIALTAVIIWNIFMVWFTRRSMQPIWRQISSL